MAASPLTSRGVRNLADGNEAGRVFLPVAQAVLQLSNHPVSGYRVVQEGNLLKHPQTLRNLIHRVPVTPGAQYQQVHLPDPAVLGPDKAVHRPQQSGVGTRVLPVSGPQHRNGQPGDP